MSLFLGILSTISGLSLVAWLYLVLGRGQFWRTDQNLSFDSEDFASLDKSKWPAVSVVIPARNEADVMPETLPVLMSQDYPGAYPIFLVDDQSNDGTGEVAYRIAHESGNEERLTIIDGLPLPQGWTGKVWALHQGVQASDAEYLLLTDADVLHHPASIKGLVSRCVSQQLDMVSLMVRLRTETFWEKLLVPAFLYFFAKLYPFRWANDRRKSTSAAAGGCILVRRTALERSGGLESIADAIIDDCSLARRIKRHTRARGGRVWIGLTQDIRSLRRYNTLKPFWDTVARTAYAQLRFSPLLLVGTVIGMLILYLWPILGSVVGLVLLAQGTYIWGIWLAVTGALTWLLMTLSYMLMLRWHGVSFLLAPTLPFVGVLYTLMTLDSALRWWRGKGGEWKGRTYSEIG